MSYTVDVKGIIETHEFARWIDGLKDLQALARIQARIYRLIHGLPGDVKPIGEGVSELRIDYGPGYRVYFIQQRGIVIVLLAGGDKRSQDKDIQTALELARNLEGGTP
jgi:putative addiction module killer protein